MDKDLIQKYIEHNFFGKLIEMDFKIISDGQIEYTITITKNLNQEKWKTWWF